jgi:hypothetical protein
VADEAVVEIDVVGNEDSVGHEPHEAVRLLRISVHLGPFRS